MPATRKERGGTMQEGAGGLDVVVRVADRAGSGFKGKLDFAENRIDNATGTMRVRARFANPDGILQPGMFGRINVPGSLPHHRRPGARRGDRRRSGPPHRVRGR